MCKRSLPVHFHRHGRGSKALIASLERRVPLQQHHINYRNNNNNNNNNGDPLAGSARQANKNQAQGKLGSQQQQSDDNVAVADLNIHVQFNPHLFHSIVREDRLEDSARKHQRQRSPENDRYNTNNNFSSNDIGVNNGSDYDDANFLEAVQVDEKKNDIEPKLTNDYVNRQVDPHIESLVSHSEYTHNHEYLNYSNYNDNHSLKDSMMISIANFESYKTVQNVMLMYLFYLVSINVIEFNLDTTLTQLYTASNSTFLSTLFVQLYDWCTNSFVR